MNTCPPTPTYNSVIAKGVLFQRSLKLSIDKTTPFDLTGYSIKAELKLTIDTNAKIDFNCEINPDPTTGQFTITLPPETTATMNVGKYLYDIVLLNVGVKTRLLLKGYMMVEAIVTND